MMVYIAAEKVLDFFRKNKVRLREEQILIAENTETNYQVYLDIDEALDRPVVRVFYGDRFESESSVPESIIISSVNEIYDKYLEPVEETQDSVDGDDEFLTAEDEQAIDDLIYEREDALELAVSDMLDVFLEQAQDDEVPTDPATLKRRQKQIAQDIVDSLAEFLITTYGISIYRPTWMDMEDGTTEAVDYPYSI